MGGQLVPLPVVVAGIHHPVLGTLRQVAAGAGRRPAIIVGTQLDAAAIRIQQHLVRIEAGTVVGAPGALDAIGITLTELDALYMDVPVVGGTVEARGERDHFRRGVVGAGKQQQFDPAGEASPDGEVDAVVLGCGPQLTAMTGGDAHDKPTQNEELQTI